jgi:hypothetical protein
MRLSHIQGLLVLLLLLFFHYSYSQKLENLRASFDGEKMVITYDLLFADPAQKFRVTLYSSHDNYARPLSLVTGDVGESVAPGVTNRVVWDVRNSLPPNFDAEVTIKIKTSKAAAADVVKLSLKPFDKSVYKKGESVAILWVGGSSSDQVNIDLLKGSKVVKRVVEKTPNAQRYTWQIPKNEKAGKGYVLRVSSATTTTELSNSQFFVIKPRIPLIVKILPVVVIGGVVAVLAGKKGGGPANDDTEEDLPGPVKPN